MMGKSGTIVINSDAGKVNPGFLASAEDIVSFMDKVEIHINLLPAYLQLLIDQRLCLDKIVRNRYFMANCHAPTTFD
jgi:hypothetical protein